MKDRAPEKVQVRHLKLERGLLRAVTKLALAIATDALTGGRPAMKHLRIRPAECSQGLLSAMPACLPAMCSVMVLSVPMIVGRDLNSRVMITLYRGSMAAGATPRADAEKS